MSGDYEIGYKKPPKHSRFAKGESGNPRGRRNGSRNLKGVVNRELDEPITIREGGVERRVSKREGIVKSLVNRALKGDVRAARELLSLAAQFEDSASAPAELPLTAEERAVLEAALARLGPQPASAAPEKEARPRSRPRRKPEPEGSA